jgi:hypothetical protein
MWKPSILAVTLLTVTLLTGLGASVHAAEPLTLNVKDAAWKLGGDARVESHLGRPALRISTGNAVREDVKMEDGTIEFDVATTPHRAFVYVQFRIRSAGEKEEFYLRTHKSEQPDAIQYTPVFKRVSNWQLYHGEGYTAATELVPKTWTHVKLVVQGRQAALFVENMAKPRIVTPLVRDPEPGYIAFRGFLPRGAAPEGVTTANFANVVVRPGVVEYAFPEITPPVSPPGVVTHWQVSKAFASQPEGVPVAVPTEIADGAWQTFAADASGLLVFDRHLTRPADTRWVAVAARLVVDAESAERRRFDFGYSDRVSVLLNGELLMSGNAGYSFNFPRRQGLIGLSQATLYLPLRKGHNELVLIVDEVFGGWGVMGQLHQP